jgi:hypothetical protein
VAEKDVTRALRTDRWTWACLGKCTAAYGARRVRVDMSGRDVAFQRDTLRCRLL